MPHSLRHLNTFGLNTTCTQLIEYSSETELREVLPQLQGKTWLQVGSGSNLLFLSPHYEGIVLHSRILGIEVIEKQSQQIILRVGAGENWDQFVAHCVAQGYHGLENLSHIPGEVGASAVQNVGAYGVEAGDHIVCVESIEVSTGKLCRFDAQQCQYAYRSSIFKHQLRNQHIITHVSFRLNPNFQPQLTHTALTQQLVACGIPPEEATARQVRQAIIAVRSAKLPDPKEVGSAGSFFMNPLIDEKQAQRLLSQYPNMPHYPSPSGVKIPAAWLIEQCGWKGKRLGSAGVHDKQALVLINAQDASGQDILALAQTIQKDVQQRFGIALQPEVLYIE